jgi:hypothetical protein
MLERVLQFEEIQNQNIFSVVERQKRIITQAGIMCAWAMAMRTRTSRRTWRCTSVT